jgi:short-subunit dehydrogenase
MKTILITGATEGVGKSTAHALAQQGHRLLLHGRNTAKLDAVIAELKTDTNNQEITSIVKTQ